MKPRNATGNIYVVRPDGTPDDNYIDTDTVSGIAVEWLRQNRNQTQFKGSFKEKQAQVEAWIEWNNHLKDGKGVECDGVKVHGGIIRPDQKLTLPAGNPVVNPPQHRVPCPVELPEVAPEGPATRVRRGHVPPPPAPPPPPPPPPPAPEVTAAPRYQAIVNSRGTVTDGHLFDRVDALDGDVPHDAAANTRGASDRARKGLRPGIQEGRIVDTSSRSATRDGVSSALETLQVPLLGGTPGGLVTLTRGKPGHEIEFERSQHYLTDRTTGEIIGVNPKNRRKLESGLNFDRDADGVIRTTQAMLAQISLNRRNNPDYHGVFGVLGIREALTSHNLNRPLTNTGEGLQYTKSYLGAEQWYEKTDTAFTAAPNAADAEKMLQLNLQLAMHPLIWSTDSYGVPVQKAQALRTEMERVVAALPEGADKARLTSTYITPYAAVMEDPVQLGAAIDANGGRKGWINPLRDEADERLKDKKVVRDFSKVPFPEDVRAELRANPDNRREIINNFRQAEAQRFLYLSADGIWNDSIRTPTQKEAELGRGALNDVEGQKEANLAPARLELLQHLRDNPEARAAWMNHMLATRGGLQNVSDLANLSSNAGTGNYALLGYPNGSAARDGAREIATGLAGEDQGKRLMHRKGGFFENLGNSLVRFGTAGLETDAFGIERRNLDRGQFGFQESTARRWNGSQEERAQVDAALVKVLDGAITAARTGTPVGNIAATGLVLTMDPDRAANLGATTTFNALASTLPAKDLKTIDNQMVANLDNAGNRYVSAAVARATKAGVIDGEKIVTVTEEQARAAAANGGIVALTAEQKATLGDLKPGERISYTTLSTEAARAVKAADAAGRAAALTTADDPSKISQNQLNALNLTRMAQASPAAFASAVTGAIVAAEKAGNGELAASLRAGVDDMRHGQGGAGDAIASLITRQAKALKAGDGSAESLAASQQEVNAFFAGRFGANRAIAAANLAGNLGSSPSVSAAMAGSLQSVLAGLPAGAQDRLVAIGEIRDPAAHAQALKAFSSEFAGQLNAIHAERGLSLVELVKWAIVIKALDKPKDPDKPKTPDDPLPHGEPPTPPTPPTPTPKPCCDGPTPPVDPVPVTPTPPVDPVPVTPTPPVPTPAPCCDPVPVDPVPPPPVAPPLPVAPPPPPPPPPAPAPVPCCGSVPIDPQLSPPPVKVGFNVPQHPPGVTGGVTATTPKDTQLAELALQRLRDKGRG